MLTRGVLIVDQRLDVGGILDLRVLVVVIALAASEHLRTVVPGTPAHSPAQLKSGRAVAAAADQCPGATARAHKQPDCRSADVLGSTDVPRTNATAAIDRWQKIRSTA
jgi:hypothetical protein